MLKYCATCGEEKSISLFQRNSYSCKECKRNENYKRRYGITLEEYSKMHISQKGLCAICENPETTIDKRSGAIKNLSVDHCHDTGKVRGLLCNNCNRGIGLLKDSSIIIYKAAKYVLDGGIDD